MTELFRRRGNQRGAILGLSADSPGRSPPMSLFLCRGKTDARRTWSRPHVLPNSTCTQVF
eukprot:4032598-Pyramimonas_sp.AAC.1